MNEKPKPIINILKGGQMTNEKNDGPEKICCKCTRKADHFWEDTGFCNTHWADKLAEINARINYRPENTLAVAAMYRLCYKCRVVVGPAHEYPSDKTLCVHCFREKQKDEDLSKAWEDFRVKLPPEFEDLKNHDPVNHPKHYTRNGIEVIDFIEAYELGFRLGNAVKYIARAGEKDPAKRIEDLKKARWYLDREISKHDSK